MGFFFFFSYFSFETHLTKTEAVPEFFCLFHPVLDGSLH